MKIRANGEIVLYNPLTNVYGAFTSNKIPKTLYKPSINNHDFSTNLEYFYKRK